MKNYSTHVKSVLDICIGEMTLNSWLYVIFEFLFHEFTSSFSYNKTLKGYRLLACVGTSINIARNPDDESSYCLTDPYGKGFNQLLLNTVYDIYNKVYLDAIIQPYREMNERQAMCDMVDHYCQNNDHKVIFTADRGYESFNTIAHFIENNAKFVLRAKNVTGKQVCYQLLGFPNKMSLMLTLNVI